MNKPETVLYEQQAEKAFSKQSAIFDELYSGNTIVQYKRKRVRDHVENLIKPGSKILELNAGTGEDAIYFAKKGHYVHATDISTGMQKELQRKIQDRNLDTLVSGELRSFTDLENLNDKGPYDLIFSNFAGLNCTNEIEKVLISFSTLVKPGGVVTLVILPKFCLWESMLMFKGKFKTAFRRFFSSNGRKARIEGEFFRCWYYNPSMIKKNLKKDFALVSREGLCSIVPPSYIENFAEKHPGWFNRLKKLEDKWKTSWPWRSIGDYYIISFRKKVV
jgi:ubiquinone/menaquinone biosynthesis C-methylase UbiE